VAGYETESGLVCFGTKAAVLYYLVMIRDLDLELVFPVRDRPSALLMELKADCLHMAGIINEQEKRWVTSKIRAVLESDYKRAA
jgi:hypothetical protein